MCSDCALATTHIQKLNRVGRLESVGDLSLGYSNNEDYHNFDDSDDDGVGQIESVKDLPRVSFPINPQPTTTGCER